MVIAGLIQEKENETKTKVPLLGDIPLLGSLFRKTERTKQKNELVIFLTPTLLTGKRIEEISFEERQRLNLEN
jgi:type IV pilus assembly protein PilQ